MLDRLYNIILSRRDQADAANSYVAQLFQKGRKKIAQKVGEEGVETTIAAIRDDRAEIISESADLLFHLSILWADAGITPQDVDNELRKREGISGIAEKQSRKD